MQGEEPAGRHRVFEDRRLWLFALTLRQVLIMTLCALEDVMGLRRSVTTRRRRTGPQRT